MEKSRNGQHGDHPMNLQESLLTRNVAITGSHHIVLGITAAFKSLISVDEPTRGESAALQAAEDAWNAATKALADYKEGKHSSSVFPRDVSAG